MLTEQRRSEQAETYNGKSGQVAGSFERDDDHGHRVKSGAVRRVWWRYLVSPAIFVIYFVRHLAAAKLRPAGGPRESMKQKLTSIAFRILDIVTAVTGLFFSLPFFILVPVLIKLDSRGPVFYKQIRVGIDRRRQDRRRANLGTGAERRVAQRRSENLYGRPFHILKFRTMRDGAERESGPVWARKGDPRVTRIGSWLRTYHIDEIPQFWNVLVGDMSLVGPRPERPDIVKSIVEEFPVYKSRLRVKPGITGLAQVCLGYDSDLEDVKLKTAYDLSYIENRSLLLNLRILCLTVSKIVFAAPVRASRLRAKLKPSLKEITELPHG